MMTFGFKSGLVGLVSFISVVHAEVAPADAIQFTNRELQASYVLVRPELSRFEFHQTTARFEPAPAIKFFGVDAQEFEVDLKKIGDIFDLRFDHLNAKMPELRFEDKKLLIEVPLIDNNKAFRSILGTIGVRNASLIASLYWRVTPSGAYRLDLRSVNYHGVIIGTGIFRSGFLLNQAKKLLVEVLENQLDKMLKKTEVQDRVTQGLLQWARAYTGETYTQIAPGTLEFFEDIGLSGIRYQVLK